MERPLSEEKVGRYTVKVYRDYNPYDPRSNDNATIMVFNHGRYTLGDKHEYGSITDLGELIDAIKNDHKVLAMKTVRMYDHSGLSLSTGSSYPFNDAWDSGIIGVAFISEESIALTHGIGFELTDEELSKIIDEEVEEYSAYVSGDMYGFIVEDQFGDNVDSCWGYTNEQQALDDGKDAANLFVAQDQEGKPITEDVASETLMKVLPKIGELISELMRRIAHMEETHGENNIDYTFEYSEAEKKLDAFIEILATAKDRVHGRNPADKGSVATKIREALGYNQ